MSLLAKKSIVLISFLHFFIKTTIFLHFLYELSFSCHIFLYIIIKRFIIICIIIQVNRVVCLPLVQITHNYIYKKISLYTYITIYPMFFCNLLYIYIFNNTVASRKCQITTAQDNRCLKLSQLQKAMSLKATLVGHVK